MIPGWSKAVPNLDGTQKTARLITPGSQLAQPRARFVSSRSGFHQAIPRKITASNPDHRRI